MGPSMLGPYMPGQTRLKKVRYSRTQTIYLFTFQQFTFILSTSATGCGLLLQRKKWRDVPALILATHNPNHRTPSRSPR